MSMGKGGGSSTTINTPSLTQEQKDMIKAQTDFFTGTVAPTYREAVTGATGLYNLNAPGVLNAAQNQARTALQAQEALGGTGESALRTGITGLQSLFDPNYEANQIMAALAPAQGQYAQNVAQQEAQFGGTGNLGSARQALAGRQLAGATQSAQMQTAAQVQAGIQAQRAQAANQLANLGQAGIGQAIGASGQAVSAAMTPQQLYNQYASVIFGTPAASYSPDFRGTQGGTTTGNQSSYNMGLNFGSGLGGAVLGSMLLSDRRVKENIERIGTREGVPVYKFNYVWDKTPRRGTMAQDLLRDPRYAHAVSRNPDGILQVDYSKLPALDKE
jgi:hypothetical protein